MGGWTTCVYIEPLVQAPLKTNRGVLLFSEWTSKSFLEIKLTDSNDTSKSRSVGVQTNIAASSWHLRFCEHTGGEHWTAHFGWNLYPSNFFVHRERVYSVDSIHSAALDWSWDREPWQGCSSTRPGTSSFPNMTLLSKVQPYHIKLIFQFFCYNYCSLNSINVSLLNTTMFLHQNAKLNCWSRIVYRNYGCFAQHSSL